VVVWIVLNKVIQHQSDLLAYSERRLLKLLASSDVEQVYFSRAVLETTALQGSLEDDFCSFRGLVEDWIQVLFRARLAVRATPEQLKDHIHMAYKDFFEAGFRHLRDAQDWSSWDELFKRWESRTVKT